MMLNSRRLFSPLQLGYRTTRTASTRAQRKQLYADLFPEKLLTQKQKTPPSMYLASAEGAQMIDGYLDPYIKRSTCDTALEISPGIGLFAQQLLRRKQRFRQLILVEPLEHFMPQLHALQSCDPKRVSIRQGDMVSLWRLAFQDKIDNGTRVAELLQDIPLREHDDDPNILMFGAVGCYNFFKYLINSLVFQNGLLTMGRCEMLLLMPPPIYIHLTCDKDIGYLIYRSATMLFQMLFEHRFIAKVPRELFLPSQGQQKINKGSKLVKVKSINPEYLYLVRIVPRRNLYDLCAAADLPALWYFVKQNCVSRRNRIIPCLEKWVPGCGPRLIINSEPTEPMRPLYADDEEDIKQLPKYSMRAQTMSTRDFYPNMNIYTQFGDLRPSQMLTLFTQFRRWREYNESSFLASLENSLLKLEMAATDESIDDIGLLEEDDIGPAEEDETAIDEELRVSDELGTPTKRTRTPSTAPNFTKS